MMTARVIIPVAFICCLHLPPAAAAGSGGPDRMLLYYGFATQFTSDEEWCF
jgi:hypothetical protein